MNDPENLFIWNRVEGYAFAGTSNVQLIQLSHNPIQRVDQYAFAGLTNIDKLIFPSGIRSLEPDAFQGLDTVGYMKLAFMDLSSLRANTFRGLTKVNILSIQESDLGVIKPGMYRSSRAIAFNQLSFAFWFASKNVRFKTTHIIGFFSLPAPSVKCAPPTDSFVSVQLN